jgi:hypothetical protein
MSLQVMRAKFLGNKREATAWARTNANAAQIHILNGFGTGLPDPHSRHSREYHRVPENDSGYFRNALPRPASEVKTCTAKSPPRRFPCSWLLMPILSIR